MTFATLSMATLTLCLVSSPGFAKPIEGQDNHPSRRARILERFDTNGDGVLDDSEKQATKEARTARREKRKDRRHGKRRQTILEQFDVNGDGMLDESERTAACEARRAKILERFDTNGDGVLEDDEKKSARKARRHRQRGRHGRQDGESRKGPVTGTNV